MTCGVESDVSSGDSGGSGNQTALIAGLVVGGILLLAVTLGLAVYYAHR